MRVVRRPRWVNIAFYLARNLRSRFTIDLNTHRQSRGQPVDESVRYVETAFEAFTRQGELTEDDLGGARVLELGPGDNLGLALRFLAAGAREVVALDKFAIRRDPETERAIHDRLRERHGGIDPEAVRVIKGVGIEDAPGELEPASFDLIVSVAVLEHVYDSDAAFAAMDSLLRPGGLMVHQVDFRDHNMFTAGGRHPLEFLTVGDRLWRRMTVDSGGPNRRLLDYYRRKVDELGYDAELIVNQLLGVEGAVQEAEVGPLQRQLIDSIRPRLQPRFRSLPDEDLAAAGLFLVARKPQPARRNTN
jgi:SAM-dependent methyltransferase